MHSKAQPQHFTDPVFTLEDTVVLMFSTYCPNYRFVMELNKAYELEMARGEDLWVEGTEYPCFSYDDEYNHMAFVMIERSSKGVSNKVFDHYDKMLLVRGRDAWSFLQHLRNNWVNNLPEPNPANWLEHRQWVLANSFNQQIFCTESFAYRAPEGFATSLYNGPQGTMPKAIGAFGKCLKGFLEEVFKELQYHLCGDFDL